MIKGANYRLVASSYIEKDPRVDFLYNSQLDSVLVLICGHWSTNT